MKKKGHAESSVMELFTVSVDKVTELSGTRSVIGERVEENGLTVLPVSKLSIGFAGGGADIVKGRKQNTPAGTGAKVSLDPVAMLVIDQEGGVRLLSVPKQEPPSHAAETVNAVAEQVRGFLSDMAAKKEAKKREKEEGKG